MCVVRLVNDCEWTTDSVLGVLYVLIEPDVLYIGEGGLCRGMEGGWQRISSCSRQREADSLASSESGFLFLAFPVQGHSCAALPADRDHLHHIVNVGSLRAQQK